MHSVLSHETRWVGNKSELSCKARKTLLWPSPYLEAKDGRSWKGLNWSYKLARETWKPSCSEVFSMRSKVTVLIFIIRTILNYFAVVPICLVCLMKLDCPGDQFVQMTLNSLTSNRERKIHRRHVYSLSPQNL